MPGWRPDLLSLRLFVAVCDEASIARAAEREAIAPSAISKRISEIEDASGVELLVRGARGVRPTPAGVALLHHARQIVASSERLQAELGEYARGARGHVRLLANISSISKRLPRDLSSFIAGHPLIRVDLQERVSAAVADGVRDGAADLGICLATADTGGLQVLPYDSDRLAVVVHPAHALARRESVTFDETLGYGFVALHPESGTTRLLAGLAARRGRRIEHRLYVSTFEAACQVIAENLAIGILSVDAVRPLLAPLGLTTVPLTDAWAVRQIVLCMRGRDALPAPARAFLDHLLARRAASQDGRR